MELLPGGENNFVFVKNENSAVDEKMVMKFNIDTYLFYSKVFKLIMGNSILLKLFVFSSRRYIAEVSISIDHRHMRSVRSLGYRRRRRRLLRWSGYFRIVHRDGW